MAYLTLKLMIASVILSSAVCCEEDIKTSQLKFAYGQCSTFHQVAVIINSFSCRLVSAIGGSGNLFISPFGLSVSLGMIYLGARGSTAAQMEEILGFGQGNQSKEEAHDIFHDMLDSLEKSRGGEYSLLAANGIFVQTGFQLLHDYVDELKKHYNAQVKNVDFADNEQDSLNVINEWASNKTNGQIQKLLQEPLDPLTELVILNAVYFKGFWKDPFSDTLTHERRFYLADGTFKRVLFMENKKKMNFFKDEETNYSFLELDYKGDHVSMLIALPNERVFPVLKLDTGLLCRLRKNMTQTEVAVILPKFNLAYEREMSNDMSKLGLTELFSPDYQSSLNLTGMRLENDLSVSMMIHKAVIEVNEQGSEASAVSGVSFVARSRVRSYQVFKANHPFLFCILEKRSGTILFMGRVAEL